MPRLTQTERERLARALREAFTDLRDMIPNENQFARIRRLHLEERSEYIGTGLRGPVCVPTFRIIDPAYPEPDEKEKNEYAQRFPFGPRWYAAGELLVRLQFAMRTLGLVGFE